MEDLCESLWEKTTAGTGYLGDVVNRGSSGSANSYFPRVVHRIPGETHDPLGDQFSSVPVPFWPDLAADNCFIGPVETMAEIDDEIFSMLHQSSSFACASSSPPLIPVSGVMRSSPVDHGELQVSSLSPRSSDWKRLHQNYSFASASAPLIPVSGVMESPPLDHRELKISSLSTGSPDYKRKSDTRRVICIPALEAGSGKPGGDVIPPDLWAWKKYGQKSIKGSPYPRGYYRCSSSNECSAKKQVEKSRSDPTMLVITYTSEHNHPWPTQQMPAMLSLRTPLPRSSGASKTGGLSLNRVSTTTEGISKDNIASAIPSIGMKGLPSSSQLAPIIFDGNWIPRN
ncbi:uncharacterized protein LOC144707771 [Wolffia australiana]